jgi:hypothetical protein
MKVKRVKHSFSLFSVMFYIKKRKEMLIREARLKIDVLESGE